MFEYIDVVLLVVTTFVCMFSRFFARRAARDSEVNLMDYLRTLKFMLACVVLYLACIVLCLIAAPADVEWRDLLAAVCGTGLSIVGLRIGLRFKRDWFAATDPAREEL